MKKLLALVLALVMTMSLVTISNAAFSDADKISHDEAVDVLNTLGVINGMPDGSFAPDGNVTRAEMAKMISIIMLGDVDASAFVGTATGLTDIKGHWAEGYIQYCYSQGIIAGRGDGTFAPNANVTAVEAAKMLLGAIGYNATVQGYTGADWAINVTRDAQLSGFYTDLKGLSSNKALTRDEAAQMIYNAVVADLIEKTPVLNVTTGTLQYEYRANSSKSLLTETFKAVKVIGEVIDNEFMSGSGMKGKTTVRVSNSDENKTYANGDTTFKITTGADELGMSVTLYVKPYAPAKTNADKATVLGSVYVNDNNAVYTTGDAIKADKIEKKLKDQGLKLDLTNGAFYMNNYAWQNGGRKVVFTYATLAALTGNGIKVSFVDVDGDGYIDNVLVLEKAFGKVSSVSTKGDGLLNIAKKGSKGANVYENEANDNVADFAKLGLAKDDYVSYYYVAGSEMYYVEKAEGKTVDVTATIGDSANDGGKFVADATYKKSALADATDMAAASGNQSTLPTAVEVGKSAVVYLDAYGYVIYVTEVDTTTTYLMVTDVKDVSSWGDALSAKVILSDGTTKTIEISKLDGKKLVKGTPATNEIKIGASASEASSAWKQIADAKVDTADSDVKIYSYTVDSNGKYELNTETTYFKNVAASATVTAIITKNNPTLALDSTLYANNATPVVMKNGSDVTLYTGISNVPTRTNSASAGVDMFAVKNTGDSFASIVFVIGGAGAIDPSNFMYFLKDQPTVTKDAKGNSVYTYDVVRDGETTTIVADSSTVVRKAGLYKVTFTGDKATSASAATADQLIALAPATGASDGVVNGKVYNDNTKFFVIKDNKATEASADTIITEGKDQDQIAIIVGENNEANIAKYVFIDRDSSVAAPTAVTYTYDGGAATAIGTVLTSPAASKSIAVTATAASGTTVTSVTVKGAGSDATGSTSATYTTVAGDIPAAGATKTLTVTVVANGATGYTKTFTYTLTLSTPNP
mgnify:CR=1 FL=1